MKCERIGVLGSGVFGGIEKSSESDSTGASDIRSPSKVTGTPNIWKTTQRQTRRIRMTEPVHEGNKRIVLLLM